MSLAPPSRRTLIGLMTAFVSTGPGRALAAVCGVALPEETEGPYPADGSHMAPPPGIGPMPGAPAQMSGQSAAAPNALKLPFIRRSDLRKSGGTGHVAEGVPLSLRIRVTGQGCQPLVNHVVYIWHCTQGGDYSLYTLPEEDFLRGTGVSDAGGYVSFETIFPGCYAGRMPHIHVEVYPSLELADSADHKIATTQFAFDRALCEQVYADAKGYEKSLPNLKNISFKTDNVFGDNSAAELLAQTVQISGNITNGFAGTVTLALGDGEREPARMGPGGPGGPPPNGRNGPPPSGAFPAPPPSLRPKNS